MIRAGLVLVLLMIAVPAFGMEYDIRYLSAPQADAVCGRALGRFMPVYGCYLGFAHHRCQIIISALAQRIGVAHVLEHEKAHCHGWVHG